MLTPAKWRERPVLSRSSWRTSRRWPRESKFKRDWTVKSLRETSARLWQGEHLKHSQPCAFPRPIFKSLKSVMYTLPDVYYFVSPWPWIADPFPGQNGAKLGPNDNEFQTRVTVTDITSKRQHVKSKLLQVERILLKLLSISEKVLHN